MEVSGHLHAQAALPPGKDPPYLLDRRFSGLQSRSGDGGEEKKSNHCPRRQLNSCRLARSLISILTEMLCDCQFN
jgi:hypothetical protein